MAPRQPPPLLLTANWPLPPGDIPALAEGGATPLEVTGQHDVEYGGHHDSNRLACRLSVPDVERQADSLPDLRVDPVGVVVDHSDAPV